MKKILLILLVISSFQTIGQISNHGMFYQTITDDNGLLNGLISVWEFDETSGTTAFDAHGSNDLTNNSASINQTGILDKAYSYSTLSTYCVNTSVNFGTNDFSMNVWFNTSYTTSYLQYLIGDRDDTGIYNGGTLAWNWTQINNNNGGIEWILRDNSDPVYSIATSSADATDYRDGNWHMATFVYIDGGISSIYMDGQFKVSTTNFTKNWSTIAFYVSRFSSTISTRYLRGLVDQICVWNIALTQEKITALYDSGNGIFYIDFTAFLKPLYDNLIPFNYEPINTPLRIAS